MSRINISKLAHFSGHQDAIYGLVSGFEANTFYTGGADGYIVSWNYETGGDGQLLIRVPAPVYTLLPISSSYQLLAGTSKGNMHVIDLGSKKEVRNIEAHQNGLYDIKPLKTDGPIVTVGGDGCVRLWDPNDFQLLYEIKASDKNARVIATSSKLNLLAVGFSDHTIRIYDQSNFTLLHTLEGHTNSVFSLAFHPEGQSLVSGGRDAMIRSWDTQTNFQETQAIPAHLLHVHSLAFSPNRKLIASTSMDKTIKLWSADSLELLKVIDHDRHQGHLNSVNKVAWIDNDRFITCSDDKTAMVWQWSEVKNV